MPRRAREQPWWIEGGSEVCPVCLQRYPYHMHHRCGSCDIAICSLCAIAENGHAITCATCKLAPSTD